VKRKLVCFCEHAFETDIPESVDLAGQPELEQAILTGDFLSVRCPRCGKVLKPEFPVLVRDPAGARSIFLVPELDRAAFHRHSLEYPVPEADRVVIGYDELAEKFRIKAQGLEDEVVELVKYYLLNKILEDDEGEEEVRILFARREEGKLIFHALGLKQGEVGVLRVPEETAAKVAAELDRRRGQEPFATILTGPYVSVNKLYVEGEE
jgi:hypothetical protein